MSRQRRRFRPAPWLLLACILGLAGLACAGEGLLNLVSANQLNADTRFIEVNQ